MKIALTEQFLDDISKLPSGLERKCRELLSSLRKIETRNIHEKALPGWRLHKLCSSPFVSLSLDMNYRVLCKIEGDTAFMYRAVKHDLADMAHINRNIGTKATYLFESTILRPADVFNALISMGVPNDSAKPFHGLQDENQLMDALEKADPDIANIALTMYETTGIVIPRARVTLLQNDKELESILAGDQARWEIYLHPSQRYIVNLPVNMRLLISGSAGTGKTVCAWYRLQYLVRQKYRVGFVCANNYILAISKQKIASLLEDSSVDAYYLVPSSEKDLLQLGEAVEHIIIDEGQEFSPTWYSSLGDFLKSHRVGLTLFYDLNQLGGNIDVGDITRYRKRMEMWDNAPERIPNATVIELYINYRNSREIAEYYYQALEEVLPYPIRSEIPVFEGGDVIIHKTRDPKQLPIIIADIIKKLRLDFKDTEIGVICIGDSGYYKDIANLLKQFGIPTSTEVNVNDTVVITSPRIIRGHERKAIIVCAPSRGLSSDKWGRAINSYIALSRARDKLIVVQTG